jgi:uncharacterized protein (TIGR03435 family)
LPLPDGPSVDPALRFEVASLKPYVDDGPARVRLQPGRLDASGVSVRTLLQIAFRVRDDEVAGLPDWSNGSRYSVLVKVPDGVSLTAVPTMLRNLLSDRFGLTFGMETREIQRFDLVMARDDRKLGPAMKPTSAECQSLLESGTAPTQLPTATDAAPCGTMQIGAGLMRATGVTLGRLVQMLSQVSGRAVNDMTELTGLHDFTLKFNPVMNLDPSPQLDTAVRSGEPELGTALTEQLGLRLVSRRGPSQVVVVATINMPALD